MKFLIALFALIASVSAFAPRANRVATKALVRFIFKLFKNQESSMNIKIYQIYYT